MEEEDDIKLLPKFCGKTNEFRFDNPVTMERESSVLLRSFRIGTHCPVFHVIDERTAGIDNDCLILPLCCLDIRKHFLIRLADGCVLPVRRIDTCHALVRIDEKHIRSGKSECGFPRSGESADDHDDVLPREVHLFGFYDCHRFPPYFSSTSM